jgi:putative FmdB family regulatory protein
MPLFEYHCSVCNYVYEKIQGFNSLEDKFCPKCASPVFRPLFSSALNFKGTGFYSTDYAKSNKNIL